jgi:hypothetical protein
MARYFDITTPAPELPLRADRTGVATFTVSNATPSTIGGQALIDPGPGAEPGWFTIDQPGRTFPPQHSESMGVTVAVPSSAAPGRYGFVLRVLLGGGVPEEDFDDSPLVTFSVPEPLPIPTTPPPPVPPPPAKKFPWWIVIVAAVIALIVIVGIVAFILTRPKPDLAIETLLLTNPTTLGIEVINQGDADAGPFELRMTVDDQIDFSLSQDFQRLRPGEKDSASFAVGVPQSASPRSFIVVVDRDNEVPESNEDNNEATLTP